MFLFLDIVAAIAAIVGIWGALGVGAVALGVAPSLGEGMKAVSRGIAEAGGWNIQAEANQQKNTVYPVDEWQLRTLTEMLKPFFNFLIYECAFISADLLKIVYRCGQPDVDLDVIDLTFRNFLREFYNLSADAPLFTWVYMANGRLHLFCAFSEKAQEWIQQQRNNARSRQIPVQRELVE